MLADTTKGPFAPVWQWVGLGEFAWVTSPWAARIFIVDRRFLAMDPVHLRGAAGRARERLARPGRGRPCRRRRRLADLSRDHLAADRAGRRDRDADPGDRGVQAGRPAQHHDRRRPRHRHRIDDPARLLRLARARPRPVGGGLLSAAVRHGRAVRLVLQSRGAAAAGRHRHERTLGSAPPRPTGLAPPVRAAARSARWRPRGKVIVYSLLAAVVGVRAVPALLGGDHLAQAADRRQRRAGLRALDRLRARTCTPGGTSWSPASATRCGPISTRSSWASSRPRSAC